MRKEYEFHQSSTSVSSNLKYAAEMFKQSELPSKLIQTYIAVKRKDFKKLKEVPQKIVDLLEPIQPNRFVQEIDALQYPGNDTGIENSLVYKQFWGSTVPDDTVLLIDPHITFLRKCANKQKSLIVTYTDDTMVDLLTIIRGYDKFHPTRLSKLNKNQKITRVLYFVRDGEPAEVASTLQQLQPYLDCNNISINILIPNAYLDRNNNQNEFRQYIFNQYIVEKIVLFDENTANIAPKKKCYLTLKLTGPEYPQKIHVEYAKYQCQNRRKSLIINEYHEMDHQFLRNTTVTLHAAFRASVDPPGNQTRKVPQRYSFTKEIDIFVTSFQAHDGWRGKYSIHQPPTQEMLARNPLSNGKIIGKSDNMYRMIPIPPAVYKFLMERKEYILTLLNAANENLPKRKQYKIERMPIASNGDWFWEACTSVQVTAAGRDLFRRIKFSEEVFLLAEEESGFDASGYPNQKAPTAYIFRREFCTSLFALGFTQEEVQYLMGHKIHDPEFSRQHFRNSDTLKYMYDRLVRRPLVEVSPDPELIYASEQSLCIQDATNVVIKIPANGHRYKIRIYNKHLSDQPTIDIHVPEEIQVAASIDQQISACSPSKTVSVLNDWRKNVSRIHSIASRQDSQEADPE